MVEEEGKRVLLTGDAHHDYILRGLTRTGFLSDSGLHVDVLKVQHHGSENNLNAEFARTVSADHYVFCGDGSHDNPHEDVLNYIFESRMSRAASVRAMASEAVDRHFHFWFSTNSDAVTAGTKKRAHFESVELQVGKLCRRLQGRMHAHFNKSAGIVLDLGVALGDQPA